MMRRMMPGIRSRIARARWLALFALVAGLVALAGAATPARAALTVIGLPADGDKVRLKETLIKRLLAAAPGETILVYAAPERVLLGTIKGPDPNRRYEATLEGRKAAIMEALVGIGRFLREPPAPDANGLLHTAPLLDQVAAEIAARHETDTRVLLFGSADFSAPRVTVGERFPSDGYLVSSRAQSPWGTLGRPNALTGARVYYCHRERPSQFPTPAFAQRKKRAWALLIQRQGGKLASFEQEEACVGRFERGEIADGAHYEVDPEDARVLKLYGPAELKFDTGPMVKISHPEMPPPAGPQNPGRSIFDLPLAPAAPRSLKTSASLAIRWDDNVDLDIYVRCSGSARFLYFGNRTTEEGVHVFDHQQATGRQIFETVQLTRDCPDISKAQVLVNFYAGRAPAPPRGTFRIALGAAAYEAPFSLACSVGNGGAGLSPTGSTSGPCWTAIPLAQVLRLPALTQGGTQ